MPELLESLVRQSEPFFDQIGVKKGETNFFSVFNAAVIPYFRKSNLPTLAIF